MHKKQKINTFNIFIYNIRSFIHSLFPHNRDLYKYINSPNIHFTLLYTKLYPWNNLNIIIHCIYQVNVYNVSKCSLAAEADHVLLKYQRPHYACIAQLVIHTQFVLKCPPFNTFKIGLWTKYGRYNGVFPLVSLKPKKIQQIWLNTFNGKKLHTNKSYSEKEINQIGC